MEIEEGIVRDDESRRIGGLDELKEEEMMFGQRVGIHRGRVERPGRDVQLGRPSDDVVGGLEGSRRFDDADMLNVVKAVGRDLERSRHERLPPPEGDSSAPRSSPAHLRPVRREDTVEDADLPDPLPSSQTLRTFVQKTDVGVEEEVP